ncbi:SDR family oxidoreductase [Sphingopyxis sp. FD7]|uniref:SDR family oxidoreductase n=1 Tax=Sphingopyxis sp. FD7 TaxID=1914525 RepID=UPI000DC61303|nr:SDR family oxidoreductase [Sphingopyxis sp. FD7]BBB14505.1 short-chain dehydrogenase [Sphingopyxis sp. FD7]
MTRPVAIVTGAARGIGAAIVLRLAQDGHDVALVDLSRDACDDAVAAARDCGVQARAFAADVSSETDVRRMVAEVEGELGAPFVLVNNAGILRDRTIANLSVADWSAVIDVNLKAAFLTCREIFPIMRREGGGRIVNLSSTAALGTYGEANYSAAKAGVIGLTRTLAIEGGRHGITANAVAPGFVVTDMTREVAQRSGVKFDEMVAQMTRETVVGRVGEPADIAHAVAFFADLRSSYVTGQTMYVAGAPRG